MSGALRVAGIGEISRQSIPMMAAAKPGSAANRTLEARPQVLTGSSDPVK